MQKVRGAPRVADLLLHTELEPYTDGPVTYSFELLHPNSVSNYSVILESSKKCSTLLKFFVKKFSFYILRFIIGYNLYKYQRQLHFFL